MQIFVRGLDGSNTAVEVEKTETVASLKAKIHTKAGIAPDRQRLVFGGKQLEDGHTLDAHNIQENSTIHLVLRVLGG